MNLPPGFPDYSPRAPTLSVTEPVTQAFARAKMMLFPFRASTWFTLGFVAWLAQLGEGGGGSFNLPNTSRSGRSGGPSLKPAIDWVMDHLDVVIMVTAAAIVIGAIIGIVVLWVSSRAQFMFIDCIVKNEAKVEEPWRRFAERGKNLFWVRFWLNLLGLLLFSLAAGAGIALAWPDIRAAVFDHAAIIGTVVAVGILFAGGIPLAIAGFLLSDFVVPAMYVFDEPAGPAWQRVKSDVLRGNLGSIVLYWLMKVLIGLGVGVVAVMVTCITCCIAALPYIGTVFLLPLHVFMRSYTLYFVSQFGPDWRLFPGEQSV